MSIKERPSTDQEDTASLDAQADKLGNFTLGLARAEARSGVEAPEDEDHPRRKSSHTRKRRRPTGRHRVEPSGRDIARMIANEADKEPSPLNPDEQHEIAKQGLAAARKEVADSRKQPTAEEIEAGRVADAAEIRRKAADSWGDQV